MSAVQELISAIEGIQDWGGTYVGECIEAVEAEGIVTESMAAYVRKLEEEGKNLRARLQTAEQQLGQVREEVEGLRGAVLEWLRVYRETDCEYDDVQGAVQMSEAAIEALSATPQEDGVPYCQYCGAKEKQFCKCKPIAKNH